MTVSCIEQFMMLKFIISERIKVMVSIIKVLLPCLQSVNHLGEWFPTPFVCDPVLLNTQLQLLLETGSFFKF